MQFEEYGVPLSAEVAVCTITMSRQERVTD